MIDRPKCRERGAGSLLRRLAHAAAAAALDEVLWHEFVDDEVREGGVGAGSDGRVRLLEVLGVEVEQALSVRAKLLNERGLPLCEEGAGRARADEMGELPKRVPVGEVYKHVAEGFHERN